MARGLCRNTASFSDPCQESIEFPSRPLPYPVCELEDADRYTTEMQAYEQAYPEYTRHLKIQAHQRKTRTKRTKQLRKGKNAVREKVVGDKGRRRRSSSATKKVSNWLNQLSESDLATTEATTSVQVRLILLPSFLSRVPGPERKGLFNGMRIEFRRHDALDRRRRYGRGRSGISRSLSISLRWFRDIPLSLGRQEETMRIAFEFCLRS